MLYYLVIPILISEQFFSMRGYLIATGLILTGVLALSLLNPAAGAIFVFMFIFCASDRLFQLQPPPA